MGVKIRNSVGRHEEDRINQMIFADNCYLFAESKEQIIKMIEDATEELKKKRLDWKEEEMELISWASTKKWETSILKTETKICDQRSDNPASHGCADLERSGLDECLEVSYERG